MFGGKYHEYSEEKEKGIWTADMCELWWAFGLNCCSLILTFVTMVFLVLDTIIGDSY